jgi:hypothetical protein
MLFLFKLIKPNFQVMGYERAMYFKKEAAPLSLSYFGLGGSKGGGFGLSKPDPPEIDGPVSTLKISFYLSPTVWHRKLHCCVSGKV